MKNLTQFSGLVKLKVADAIQLNYNIIIRDEINYNVKNFRNKKHCIKLLKGTILMHIT